MVVLEVVELSEERDEEGDNVREEAFWVAELGEKQDVCGEADCPETGQSGII